jgi:hypothetical protein
LPAKTRFSLHRIEVIYRATLMIIFTALRDGTLVYRTTYTDHAEAYAAIASYPACEVRLEDGDGAILISVGPCLAYPVPRVTR